MTIVTIAIAILAMVSGWQSEHRQRCAANKTELCIPTQFSLQRFTSKTKNSPTHPKSSKLITINHQKSSKIHINSSSATPWHTTQTTKQTYPSHLQCVSSLGSTSAPPCFEVGHPAALPGPLSKALRAIRCNSNSWQSSKTGFHRVGRLVLKRIKMLRASVLPTTNSSICNFKTQQLE